MHVDFPDLLAGKEVEAANSVVSISDILMIADSHDFAVVYLFVCLNDF